MKKFLKIFVPVLLSLCIVFGTGWYLFVYDRDFTRDALLYSARKFEEKGQLDVASWLYDLAYLQGSGSEAVAIELANQYIDAGNFTQAEVTLNRAIKDGGGMEVYIALCKAFVMQDKLIDAVELLDSRISDPQIKAQIDALRPAAPTTDQASGYYTQHISVHIQAPDSALYVSTNGQMPSVRKDGYGQEPVVLVDGENTIQAIAVSKAGLVSPLSVFQYTVGGVIETVVFEDAAVEQALRAAINASTSKVLKSNDFWQITEFTVPEGAQSYADLRHLIYLESLTIENGVSGQLGFLSKLTELEKLSITDTPVSPEELEVIGSLVTLKSLTLNGCRLSTAAELSTLTGLTYLDLSNNPIRNISAISQMTDLKALYMSHAALQDLSALTSCAVLSALDVSNNSLMSVSALAGIPMLSYVDISHNQITDISLLGRLKNLNQLHAGHNRISDISHLAACTELTYLDISNNTVSSITALANLDHVTYLNFSRNQVTELPQWPSSSQLVTIDGSYNDLSSLKGLSNLRHINNILMDYNEKISDVSVLAACPVLIQVNVYGTAVKDVSILTEQSVIVNYNPL